MTDRFVFSCRLCNIAVVAGVIRPEHECPNCGEVEDEWGSTVWLREGQIR